MNHNLYQFLFGHLCFCADLLINRCVGEPYIILMSVEAAFCWTRSSIPILGVRTVIFLLQLWSQGSLSYYTHHSQGYSMVSSTNNHKANKFFPKFKLHFLCWNWGLVFLFLVLPSCKNTHKKNLICDKFMFVAFHRSAFLTAMLCTVETNPREVSLEKPSNQGKL